MTAKPTRIGLATSSRSKPPVLQYRDGCWQLWTAYNPDLTHGTYFALFSNGECSRVTIHPDDTETVISLVKEATQ